MVFFLYGDDVLSLSRKSQDILDRFREKNKNNFVSFVLQKNKDKALEDLENDTIENFKAFLKQQSLFQVKKIAVISGFNVFNLKEKQSIFDFLLLENLFKETEVFIIIKYSGLINKKDNSIVEKIIKESNSQKFELSSDTRSLAKKILSFFAKNNLELDISALNCASQLFKNRPEFLFSELNRIIPYFIFKNINNIEWSDLKSVVNITIETDLYKFLDALMLKDKKNIFSSLDQIMKNDEFERFIYNIRILAERLILVKSMQIEGLEYKAILKTLKLHPYYFKKLVDFSRNFNLSSFKKIYKDLFLIELGRERGQLRNKKLALSFFVFDQIFI